MAFAPMFSTMNCLLSFFNKVLRRFKYLPASQLPVASYQLISRRRCNPPFAGLSTIYTHEPHPAWVVWEIEPHVARILDGHVFRYSRSTSLNFSDRMLARTYLHCFAFFIWQWAKYQVLLQVCVCLFLIYLLFILSKSISFIVQSVLDGWSAVFFSTQQYLACKSTKKKAAFCIWKKRNLFALIKSDFMLSEIIDVFNLIQLMV